MELELNKNRLSYKTPIIMKRIVKEETFELIIPDSQPDILRVISVNAVPLLRAKDTDDKKISISCNCDVTILYEPEVGSGVGRLNTNSQFTAALEDENIMQDSYIISHVSVVSCDAKMINSRKLIVRVELMYSLQVYNSFESFIPCGIKDEDGIQILSESKELILPKAINEKTFVITDNVDVSSDIDEIVCSNVTFDVSDVKLVGNKAVVKGDAITKMIFEAGNALKSASFRSPFSQIVELDSDVEAEKIATDVMQTSMYVAKIFSESASKEEISIEIHAVIQCAAYYKENITYIADVYDLKRELETEFCESNIHNLLDISHMTSNVRANIETEQGVRDVVSIREFESVPSVVCQGNGLTVTLPLSFSVLFSSGDDYNSVNKKSEAVFEKMCDPNTEYYVLDWLNEINNNFFENEVGINAEVVINLMETSVCNISYVNRISYDEDKCKDSSNMPSLIVYRVPENASVWEICKKFNSVKSALLEANDLQGEDEVTAGMKILIPKIE